MTSPESDSESWEFRVRQGDWTALATLFALHQPRLRRWVELRLDPRLRGRLSPSDVIQDVYLASEQRLDHFRDLPDMSFPIWVTLIAGQRLADAHRRHLGAEVRDASREVRLDRAGPPPRGPPSPPPQGQQPPPGSQPGVPLAGLARNELSRWFAGQGKSASVAYSQLSSTQQAQLLAFLNSL